MSTITLSIPDVSCGHCVATITNALKGLPGLSDVAVSVSTKQARLHLTNDQVLPEVLRRLDSEGYPATVSER